MKRINLVFIIIIHSLSAILTILANSVIIDMAFIALTLTVMAKLVSLARHFVLDYVRENEQGEY